MPLIATEAGKNRNLRLLPRRVLEKLKCFQCKNYLCVPPILIHPKYGNMCGVCSKEQLSQEEFIRNDQYELLAQYMLFPCINPTCKSRFPFGKIEDCCSNKYQCPGTNEPCPWLGPDTNLKNHYMKQHPQFFINTTDYFSPQISSNSEEFRLVTCEEKIFLLQTKCVFRDAMFLVVVRYVGKIQNSGLFRYKLKFYKNDANKSFTTRENVVQTDISLEIDRNYCVQVDLEELIHYFDIPDSIKCRIILIDYPNNVNEKI